MSLMRTGSFDPFRGVIRHYQAARRLSSYFANSRPSAHALVSEKTKSARKSSDYRGAMNDVFDSMERDLLMAPWGSATRFPTAHMLAGIPGGAGGGFVGGVGDGKFGMHLDFHETDGGFELTADLPGVQKEDITVDVDNASGVLTVSGERKSKREEKNEGGEEGERKYHFVERSYGKTTRSIRLPETADASKANADYSGGVLTLTFPKREVAATRRIRIPVEGDGGKLSTTEEGGGTAPAAEGDSV